MASMLSRVEGSFYRSQHELIGVFRVGNEPHLNNVELGRHGRSRSNVWHYGSHSTRSSQMRETRGRIRKNKSNKSRTASLPSGSSVSPSHGEKAFRSRGRSYGSHHKSIELRFSVEPTA